MRIAAVGDMACAPADPNFNGGAGTASNCGEAADSARMQTDPTIDMLLGLGDYQYGCGTPAEFAQSYGPTWGFFNDITDYHSDKEEEICAVLSEVGVRILEGESAVVSVNGERLGVAGIKGFGGGFPGGMVTAFGEPETKAFARHGMEAAERLGCALDELTRSGVSQRVALLHYAPIEATLVGEHEQVWPFLGNYLLAEAVDRLGADLVLHGHAHRGSAEGATARGVPVRNVAYPVINQPYLVIELNGEPLE